MFVSGMHLWLFRFGQYFYGELGFDPEYSVCEKSKVLSLLSENAATCGIDLNTKDNYGITVFIMNALETIQM